ncbi:AraC family transcriptional regulator [Chelativorans salis]|uniref:AraC family transcriptional regulator n=1 Tax=Chelativorans salis TaxID=2978478 RepID=A0ABT2LVA6_9HYPH|nr:AraC family transcriptional regulator [Chelativorans sp. EGI FJ00035]MCT7378316.1 AraC family transcriptional regulator [Chelativorans sp. EGI FJ00035]
MPGLRTLHVAEAVAAISARYRPHSLMMPKGETALDFRHHAIVCEGASLNLLRYGPDVVVEAGMFDSFYMLEFPLSGGADVHYGNRRVSSRKGSGLILSPGSYVRSNWHADTTQIMLRLERSYVERAYQRFVGRPLRSTPVFAPEIDLAMLAGRRIARLIGLMVAEQLEISSSSFAAPSPAPLVNAVLETVFEHIPCTAVETASAIAGGPLPYYVHRFKAILDDTSMLGMSIGALAARIGVSQRTLTNGMRRFVGVSPHEYLTMRRMEHACMLLEHSDLSVGDIARHVGYANAGRFAATFRRYSGANPVQFGKFFRA